MLAPPCEKVIYLAFVVVAVLWRLVSYARQVTHNFEGIHRGGELRDLIRELLLLPEDVCDDEEYALYHGL